MTDTPRGTFVPPRKVPIMRVFTHEFRRMEDLDRYLGKLHEELKEATNAGNSAKTQATAYSIISVMREIDKIKHEQEVKRIQFRLRDIVTHACQGTMDRQEALEKIKKLI